MAEAKPKLPGASLKTFGVSPPSAPVCGAFKNFMPIDETDVPPSPPSTAPASTAILHTCTGPTAPDTLRNHWLEAGRDAERHRLRSSEFKWVTRYERTAVVEERKYSDTPLQKAETAPRK